MLNLEQVKMLFAKEAVVFSGNNGVPLYRATELFGEEAAQFAARKKPIINGSMRIIYAIG